MILIQDIILESTTKFLENEITELFKNDQIEGNYKKMFDEKLYGMRKKEECNIKIVDFILSNYKNIN
jgi:hypothetical protein